MQRHVFLTLSRGRPSRSQCSDNFQAESKSLVRWQLNPGGDAGALGAEGWNHQWLEERHSSKVNERETGSLHSAGCALSVTRRLAKGNGARCKRHFPAIPETAIPMRMHFLVMPNNSGLWREFFRCKIVELATSRKIGMIIRSPRNCSPPFLTRQPASRHTSHRAPASTDAARKADGRVRRVALLGCAPKSHSRQSLFTKLSSKLLTTSS